LYRGKKPVERGGRGGKTASGTEEGHEHVVGRRVGLLKTGAPLFGVQEKGKEKGRAKGEQESSRSISDRAKGTDKGGGSWEKT